LTRGSGPGIMATYESVLGCMAKRAKGVPEDGPAINCSLLDVRRR
jgi:hypothetical protein